MFNRFFSIDNVIFTDMIKENYRVIGVMSGTSLDGVDLALVDFYFDESINFSIKETTTIPYSLDWYYILKRLTTMNASTLKQIDKNYTVLLSKIISRFMKDNAINIVDAVCSHGHTALHQPERGFTYQIGNLPELSKLINQKVVCDFRRQDVALGGQGAPLVPVGDHLLFSDYGFCLNLGGFANISAEIEGQRIAFDICPVNIVLNHYSRILGVDYDDKGLIAQSGAVNQDLLECLNANEFYHKTFPKSLGLEWVNAQIFPLIDGFQMEIKDIMRTFVEHISIQITKQLQIKKRTKVLVTGGGAYNKFLMERIIAHTSHKVIIPNSSLIEYKEAMIFGLLGTLKLRNEINCLSTVTGASFDHSSGKIFLP